MNLRINRDAAVAVRQPSQLANAAIAAIDVAHTPGIGPKRSAALRQRNICSLSDAVLHLPYRYEDLRSRNAVGELRPGMDAVIAGELINVAPRPMRGRRWRQMTTAFLRDAAGKGIRVVWFNLRGDGRMPAGEPLIIAGRVTAGADGTPEMVHPEVFRARGGEMPSIRPVYSLPPEVPQRVFAGVVADGLERAGMEDLGVMPSEMREAAAISSLSESLEYLHRPPAHADIEVLNACETAAHQMLALDEMFTFQLALGRERMRHGRRAGAVLNGRSRLTRELLAALPFTPTAAQHRAIGEISADLEAPVQMNRILIGDVGSGKTLVAFHAALRAVESGWQAAMMAPTELLAEQHARTFARLCAPLGISSAVLTGKVAGSDRARLLRAVARGDIAVVFGTQALIQQGVAMKRLGLAIIDEQHRFGVFDRARLVALGSEANVLLITATPIPRSLALTLFRSLEVSALDEMPPGRTPVKTTIYPEDALAGVDAIVRAELDAGHRGYYVLPLIEGEEDPASVVAATKRLRAGCLKDFRMGTLHGRMRPAEKDRVMREFRDGALDVLVSTTVVEVGIDVPEATVIVVMAADRYGLAQLHQLRGRVGRGDAPSRCCLVASAGASSVAMERLAALARSNSGADVAHLDLARRGPGDLFGSRQTGALPLRFAGWIRDFALIERAGDMAQAWLKRDPALETPASAGARAALGRMFDFGFSLGDVG